ncbi:MAG: ABC transporter permease [Proteobacteria bacterium]|nr:ABC transporter permease [Pseudomonadota bacterium]MBU1715974.1 ABC transporter permease [Pseudomonadota bacterium]
MLEILDLPALALNCLFSISRVMAGVSMAIVIGIAVGLSRSILPAGLKRNKLVKFLFEAPKFPPPIAWIPFVILLCGIGEFSAYIIVFIGAFSPIFTSTYDGAESVSPAIRDCARSLEIKGARFLWQIIFPAALPQIFTGIRVGVSMGWMSVIAAEMISGQSGLGYSIQLNRLNMQYDLMTVDIVMIGIIGFLLFESTVFLQKKIIPWHEAGGM